MRSLYPERYFRFLVEFIEFGRDAHPEFTTDELNVFVQAFREFDLDSSGTIDAKELGLVFKSMGQGVSPEEVERLANSTGTGELTWLQFLGVLFT